MNYLNAWVEIDRRRIRTTKSETAAYMHDTLTVEFDRGNDVGDITTAELNFSLIIPARATNPLKIGSHVEARTQVSTLFSGYVSAFEYRVVPENKAAKTDPFIRQRISATVTAVDPAYKYDNIRVPNEEESGVAEITLGDAIGLIEEECSNAGKPLDISVPSYTGDLSQPHLKITLAKSKIFDGSPVLEALQSVARTLGRRIHFSRVNPDRVELAEFVQVRKDADIIPATAVETSDVWATAVDEKPSRIETRWFKIVDDKLDENVWFFNKKDVENSVIRRIDTPTTDSDTARNLVIRINGRPQPLMSLRNIRVLWTAAAAWHGPFGDVLLGGMFSNPRRTYAVLGAVAPTPELSNIGGVVSKARLTVNPSPTSSGLRRGELELTLHPGDITPSGDWPELFKHWQDLPPRMSWEYASYPQTWERYANPPKLGGVQIN